MSDDFHHKTQSGYGWIEGLEEIRMRWIHMNEEIFCLDI